MDSNICKCGGDKLRLYCCVKMVEGARVSYLILVVEITVVVNSINVRIGQNSSHISVAQKVRQNTLVANAFECFSSDM